jgi:hypothetical protein
MAPRRKLLLGLLVLGLALVAGAGWWWYTGFRPLPFKVVLRGSSSSSGQLGVSGGNLVIDVPKPGLFFGTVRKPGSQEQFTYVILFRYGHPRSGGPNRGIQFHCRSDGRRAETRDAIDLDGRRIEAVYHIELSETLTAVAKESLTLDGKNQDLSSGQVFLIDLTAEMPGYRQKKVDLPAISSRLETAEDVERLAEAIRKSLESQDPEIKAFLR